MVPFPITQPMILKSEKRVKSWFLGNGHKPPWLCSVMYPLRNVCHWESLPVSKLRDHDCITKVNQIFSQESSFLWIPIPQSLEKNKESKVVKGEGGRLLSKMKEIKDCVYPSLPSSPPLHLYSVKYGNIFT